MDVKFLGTPGAFIQSIETIEIDNPNPWHPYVSRTVK